MKIPAIQRRPRRALGFSLIELMVGIAIGMIAVIVISQVFASSEGFRRTTTGTDEATSSGAVAMVGLQRDVKQAGYGLNAFNLSGCNLALPAPAGWTINAIAPITINHPNIPPGDADTDTLTIMAAGGNSTPEGDRVLAQPAATQYAVAAYASFTPGDRLIALPNPTPAPCNVTLETSAPVGTPNIAVATGTPAMTNGVLFNLGTDPRLIVYAVRGGNLTVCDYTANNCANPANVADDAVWVPVAGNVVSLRAEYGRDTTAPTMDAIVDRFDQMAPANACQRARITAVRLVLVARSPQLERDAVTTDAMVPRWAGTAVTAAHPVAVPIDLSDDANWRRYRYRSFEATVPMRNMTWQGVQAGC